MEQETIAIIGCGAMGSAIAQAAVRKRLFLPTQMLLVDRDSSRSRALADALHARSCELTSSAVSQAQGEVSQATVVVVAVKPQDSEPLMKDLASLPANETRLFISIMAGVSVATIESALGGSASVSVPVVRAMPNLPAQCGAGMSVYFAGEHVSEESRERAQSIFETFGRTLQVREERMLDAATAISGTGPAYLYFLVEQLKSVALELGFSEGEAALLLEQTVDGALTLWRETGKSPAELISNVASKGGTTEAALAVLNERGAALAVQDAVRAAHARSVELGTRSRSNGNPNRKA